MLSIVLFFASCIVVLHSQVAWSTASSAPSGPWLKYGEGFFLCLLPFFGGKLFVPPLLVMKDPYFTGLVLSGTSATGVN